MRIQVFASFHTTSLITLISEWGVGGGSKFVCTTHFEKLNQGSKATLLSIYQNSGSLSSFPLSFCEEGDLTVLVQKPVRNNVYLMARGLYAEWLIALKRIYLKFPLLATLKPLRRSSLSKFETPAISRTALLIPRTYSTGATVVVSLRNCFTFPCKIILQLNFTLISSKSINSLTWVLKKEASFSKMADTSPFSPVRTIFWPRVL